METQVDELREDLLALPLKTRASLAKALIESLDEGEAAPDTESLWIEEVQRRAAALKSGKASTKPVEQVIKEARELLKCMK